MVSLDLSVEALRRAGTVGGGSMDRVRGDARAPPFRDGTFHTVGVLGNTLGFAGLDSDVVLARAQDLVAPGGRLLLEVAPGPGEGSSYLARLPGGAVRRMLRAPIPAVLRRIDAEGFRALPSRRGEHAGFRRWDVAQLSGRMAADGWTLEETVAVAPALGGEPDRVAEVRSDPKAWEHLLAIEEELGRQPERWRRAAAVLLAASRSPGARIK